METYRNLSGQSGVVRYEIGADYIVVEFSPSRLHAGTFYKYSCVRPGRAAVDHMKQLARAGRGLATYITKHVGKNYESRW